MSDLVPTGSLSRTAEAIVRLAEGPRGFQESRVLKSPLPERLVLLVKRVAGYPDPGDATGLVHLAPFVS
jgi:hypothetical protein